MRFGPRQHRSCRLRNRCYPTRTNAIRNAFTNKLGHLATLSDGDVALIEAASGNSRVVAPRHDLIREGDRRGPVFVVLEGWACRYALLPDGGRQITAFLMPGDSCDLHVSVLDEMDHTIGTITKCRIASIARDRMGELLEASPSLTGAFWRAQLTDEGVMRQWIISMGRRDSTQRVAHLMLELYARMRSVGLTDDDGGCEMPLTQTVLADALGLTPVHVNRVLRTLRERRVMELGAGKLSILAPNELVRVAGFDDSYLHRRLKRTA